MTFQSIGILPTLGTLSTARSQISLATLLRIAARKCALVPQTVLQWEEDRLAQHQPQVLACLHMWICKRAVRGVQPPLYLCPPTNRRVSLHRKWPPVREPHWRNGCLWMTRLYVSWR